MKKEFNTWRIWAAAVVALVLVGYSAWLNGWFSTPQPPRSANSIRVLEPYRAAGTWVFDDPAVGLVREPFVAGIPEMIDDMVKDIPDAGKGFRLLFSAQPFPGYTQKLVWKRGDKTGNWYYSEQYKEEGWLCSGLFKYYKDAPREIYVKAEKK